MEYYGFYSKLVRLKVWKSNHHTLEEFSFYSKLVRLKGNR